MKKPMVKILESKRVRNLERERVMKLKRKRTWLSSLQQNTFQNRKIHILTIVDKLRLYRFGRPIKKSISHGITLIKILIVKERPALSKQ